MDFKDFAQHKFDLVSAIFVFLVVLLCMIHFAHHQDAKPLDWALHAADLVLGVIVGGMRISNKTDDKKGGSDGTTV